LRSDLQAFGPILLPVWTTSLREELSWLADALGDVRDADVLLERLERMVPALEDGQHGAGGLLVERLRAQRDDARARLLEVLDAQRYLDLLDRLVDAVQRPALTSQGDRNAAKVLPSLAAEPWHRLRKAVDALGQVPTDEDLHKVRIRAKRARYAAELASLSAGKPARSFAKAIAGLQDVLGALHDATVSQAWLQAAAEQVPSAPAAVARHLALQERAAADRLHREWDAAWKAVDKKGLRAWLRS
ncbi:MAG: CHAD domain-containing protein, partial [Acidimicrobiales bacterium]